MNNRLIEIYRMTQQVLKEYVFLGLKTTHKNVEKGDGYVFAQGTFPVLLVAHMDTVHKEIPRTIYTDNNGIVSSPQGIGGDDRNGIYSVLEICKTHHCSVLFTEDEEIGGVGANKFIKTKLAKSLVGKFNYIIELDRKGSHDAVFYECDNPDFTKFITKEFFKEAYGSYSDICDLAPFLECAAVNLSTGYYNAHTLQEYVVLSEIDTIIEETKKLLDRTDQEKDKYDFIEAAYNKNFFGHGCGWNWYNNYGNNETESFNETLYGFEYTDLETGEYTTEEIWAANEMDALGQFLFEHSDMTYNQIDSFYEV